MTIKEQLYDAIDEAEAEVFKHSSIWKIDLNKAAHNCEQVVEDIAIQFLEWIGNNTYYNSGGWVLIEEDEFMTRKELFELFKKENNL